jgi:DNA-binding transcriptional LysR family regulator
MAIHATFRQLRLFLSFADHGGVSAAARASHVTQPTVSMQLRELEHAVGMPLHEKVGSRVFLTPAGAALAGAARAIEREWAHFEQQIDSQKGVTRGKLSVSFASTASYFLPRLLSGFCAEHPKVDLAFEVQNRDGVIARLRENRDDLYVLSVPPRDVALDVLPFLANPLVLVAPRRHPLARRKSIALASLASERFILREAGSGTRLTCDAFFKRARFSPDVRLELGSNEAIKEAVAGGLGIGIVSAHSISRGDRIATLPVRGFPLQSTWSILHPRGKKLSPIAQSFLRHLLAHATAARGSRA